MLKCSICKKNGFWKFFGKMDPPLYIAGGFLKKIFGKFLYLFYMKYTLSNQQLFSLLDKFFSVWYSEVKFKKQKGYIWIYNGKKIHKTYRKVNGVYVKPNVMMYYSPFGSFLEINPAIYQNIIKWIPFFTGKKMVIDFFTDWFRNKFNVDISRTYIADKGIMDNMD